MQSNASVKPRLGSTTSDSVDYRRRPRGSVQDAMWRAYQEQFSDLDYPGRASRPDAPEWRSEVALKVSELLDLSDNWDSYDAPPIRSETGAFAMQILSMFATPETPVPSVVPSPVGGIQFEWHIADLDFEIHVAAPYEVEFLFDDHRIEEPVSDTLSDDLGALAQPFARLAKPRESVHGG